MKYLSRLTPGVSDASFPVSVVSRQYIFREVSVLMI